MVRYSIARSILTKTSGFIAEAGFTHSLSPARNCTFGCTYCYVPTMGIYGGLKPEDWQRWGQFTTFKTNAAELLARELRPSQRVYCSPLVDPYQPAEERQRQMPGILQTAIASPPRVFVLHTSGPLIPRDLDLLESLAQRTIETYASLAPLLPCDPQALAHAAINTSGRDLIGDPFHVRAVKPRGASTRAAAFRVSAANDHEKWLDPAFQAEAVAVIDRAARALGHAFETGPRGFARLAV